MSEAAPELLTVAEAADALGVSVRTLRRLLSEASFAGRTQAIERRTAKGPRMTAMLPPELLADLRAHFHRGKREQTEAGYRGKAQAESEAHSEASGGTPPYAPSNEAQAGAMPAVAYLGSYQRVIAALETQNAELRADKERLYAALQLAQENLTREQSLRLLSIERAELPTSVDTPPESVKNPRDGGVKGEHLTSKAAPKSEATPKRGWWERLWGKKDK